jgi:hypothetical protein
MLTTLKEWENALQAQVAGGSILLGQLPLGGEPYDQTDLQTLGHLLSRRFQNGSNFYRNLQFIQRRYPLCLALCLVLHGIYDYERGVYWPELLQQLGLSPNGNYSSAIGQAFREILAKFRLPSFAHIHGQTNLVPILAHGGIPNYSLGDFFRLLQRTTQQRLIRVDAETLIEEWAATEDEAFVWIDMPVKRFVLHGGAVAEDFIDQCITLLYDADITEGTSLELPERVVRGYREWRNKNRGARGSNASQIRLRRPLLYLDPYGEGVGLELPPPFYPLGHGISSLHWEIEAGQQTFEVATDRRRVEDGYEYDAFHNLQVPVAPSYRVSLCTPTEVVRSWTLGGLDENQLLMFDPDTWTALKADEYKRPGERWILYPREGKLTIEGGRVTTEFPPQYGDWSPYCVEEWVVPAATTLRLELPDKEPYRLEIVDELSLRRPHFDGGKKVLRYHVNPRFPLYNDQPPSLRIAFAQKPDRAQLERWRISIRPEGLARPAKPVAHSLSELIGHLTYDEDNSVLLNLTAPELLGARPMGKFEIYAQGPFGQSRRLGLRVVPYLRVLGDNELHLARPEASAKLQLTCDAGSRIRLHSHEEEVEVISNTVAPNHIVVCAPAHIHTLKFSVDEAGGITVPFTIRLRRLRWALYQGAGRDDLKWESSPLRLFPDILEDTYNAGLYVELPPFFEDRQLYGGWRLIDDGGCVRAERPPADEHARRQYAIPLPELMAEYRHSRARGETLRLQIWVNEVEQKIQKAQHFVDAMYLLPSLKVDEVNYEWEQADTGVYLNLELKGPLQERNRVIYLWPADVPWIEQPREIAIPDVNSSSYRVFVPNIYGSDDYRGVLLAAIEIKNPWISQEPERPTPDQVNAFIISPPQAEHYYAGLQEAVDAGKAGAEEMLVLLHYYHRNGANDHMHHINRQLRQAARRERMPLEQLVLWAELVQVLDSTAYKLVQFTLFTVETIEALEKSPLSTTWRQRYFAHLPDDMPKQVDIYEYLLTAGFPEVRNRCIAGLCRKGRETGIESLLSDVQSGRILARDAVEYLLPAVEKVAPYLVRKGTDDAVSLLHLLAARTTAPISWLQPGLWLQTDIGGGEIQSLSETATGQPAACCTLDESVLVEVAQTPDSGQPSFQIDLAARRVRVMSDGAYQCVCCRYIFDSHDAVVDHYRQIHPDESLEFRHLTGEKTIMSIHTVAVQYR